MRLGVGVMGEQESQGGDVVKSETLILSNLLKEMTRNLNPNQFYYLVVTMGQSTSVNWLTHL